ncbi:MAG: GxxExxY protein [FCB group bacterium]|jgi:GxxExxY protein|nr:GxxExxY protein [FCB group bacterium]
MPDFAPIPDETEAIGRQVVDSAYSVHRELGPGLIEPIYEPCFIHELRLRGLNVQRQQVLPICYKGLRLEKALRLDLLVNESVIVELKAVELILPVFRAQLLSYLRLTDLRLGYLINFNVPLIKDGIERIIR